MEQSKKKKNIEKCDLLLLFTFKSVSLFNCFFVFLLKPLKDHRVISWLFVNRRWTSVGRGALKGNNPAKQQLFCSYFWDLFWCKSNFMRCPCFMWKTHRSCQMADSFHLGWRICSLLYLFKKMSRLYVYLGQSRHMLRFIVYLTVYLRSHHRLVR